MIAAGGIQFSLDDETPIPPSLQGFRRRASMVAPGVRIEVAVGVVAVAVRTGT